VAQSTSTRSATQPSASNVARIRASKRDADSGAQVGHATVIGKSAARATRGSAASNTAIVEHHHRIVTNRPFLPLRSHLRGS
jgi:hypothetical protein